MKQLGFDFQHAPPAAPVEEAATAEEFELADALRLERNVAMLAGAGAGKTHSLVTMCLHLLSGARAQGAIECAQLCLLTFTEKAADEMRGRLRARLDALAAGGDEPELRRSFERAGLEFLKPAKWRALRDELGTATIGTFHSLCVQLLRRSAYAANFELLEEREAARLLKDLTERVVLERVEQGGPFRELVADLGFDRLVAGLAPIVSRLREEGLSAETVAIADAGVLRERFDAALGELRTLARSIQPKPGKQTEALRLFMQVLPRVTFENFEALLGELRAAVKGAQAPLDVLRKALAADEPGPLNISQLYAATLLAPREAEVRDVLRDIVIAFERALSARSALDFTGLLVRTRELLRDDLDARRAAQERLGALLVDEFQDTNRLQLEIVLLLSEQRGLNVSQAFEGRHEEIVALPQRSGFLAVVGDRKQSIYEFRGADVSVFEVMARAIERNGGGRAYLRTSRRSSAPLLEHFNAGFARLMGAAAYGDAPADFEVVYEPEHDDLRAHREDVPVGVPIVELTDSTLPSKYDAQVTREHDADAIAKAIVHAMRTWEITGRGIAVLFQRFTQVELYRQALVRHAVRHRVVRGRGFYGAQEIIDLASLLTLLTQPDDAFSLSVVLRSPLVGLRDAEWISLAQPRVGERWGLDARAVLDGPLDAFTLADDARAQLQRFRERFAELRLAARVLGLRALLRLVVQRFEFRVALAASPFGEQALANLDKLLALALEREQRGVSVAAFAAELLALADEAPREAEGEVVDELDADAVTLCTVHQAKGLEWPVVVLPDLVTAPRGESAAVRFDRQFGLALVKPSRGEEELKSASAAKVTAQLTRRARAENLRLLYVAMTRARDHVILGLRYPRAKTWANDVDAFFELRVTHGTREQWEVTTLPTARPEVSAPVETPDVSALIARVRAPAPSASRELVLPVTQLHDFVSCPRWFHFAHQLGVPAAPAPVTAHGLGREHGIAAHRLLQHTPLNLVGTSRLRPALLELQRAERLDTNVVSLVERFWHSEFGRELASARAHRELPFALRLRGTPDLVLRGQLDVLLERDNELLVIDYKTTARTSLAPYRFQLGCYALAARRFIGDARPIRTGVVFLLDDALEPVFEAVHLDDAELRRAAADFAQAQRLGAWPGRERLTCEALGCGYLGRCYGDL